jgi:AcrR family transcriptional regulator
VNGQGRDAQVVNEASSARRAVRRRNRRGEGGRLRAEILAAATEILETGGDERAVTLRAVARKAGIAAPSIYPHFPGRSVLLIDVARQSFTELSGRIRSARDEAGDDARERLYAVCRAYLDFAREHPERYRAMFGAASAAGDETRRVLADRLVGRLADCLAECVAAGHCASTDPAADAVALWIGLHGLADQRALSHSFVWPDDIVQRVAFPLSHLAGRTR